MQAVVTRAGVRADSRIMDVGSGRGILLRFLEGAGVKQVRYRYSECSAFVSVAGVGLFRFVVPCSGMDRSSGCSLKALLCRSLNERIAGDGVIGIHLKGQWSFAWYL